MDSRSPDLARSLSRRKQAMADQVRSRGPMRSSNDRITRWRSYAPNNETGYALGSRTACVCIPSGATLTISFLSMPSIGWTKVEQHPFSFANSPVEGLNNDAVFLVKAEQGESFPRRI